MDHLMLNNHFIFNTSKIGKDPNWKYSLPHRVTYLAKSLKAFERPGWFAVDKKEGQEWPIIQEINS